LAESELAADITPLFAASVNEFAAIGFALNNIYAIGRLANGADGILITYSSPHSRLLASQALLIKQGKVQANYREFIAKQAGVNKYLVVTNNMTVLSFIIPSKINRSVEPDTPIQAHFAATDACVSRLFADGIEDISSERTLAAMAKRLDEKTTKKYNAATWSITEPLWLLLERRLHWRLQPSISVKRHAVKKTIIEGPGALSLVQGVMRGCRPWPTPYRGGCRQPGPAFAGPDSL